MEVVMQTQPLSMGWCLDCHRAPEKHLRPTSEVTNMSWVPPGALRATSTKRRTRRRSWLRWQRQYTMPRPG